MNLAPITLFVYNRPENTAQTLEALSNNDLSSESDLFVFCDGPKENADDDTKKAIQKVRDVVKSKSWCETVTIYESDTNKGLADSIVEGVTKIVNKFGKIIVLEDDIVTSNGFLKYMNEALDLYENEKKVMHIASYLPYTNSISSLPETFLSRFMSCWGWATWKTDWDKANWDTQFLYDQIADSKVRYAFNLEGVLNYHEQLENNLNGKINTWAIKWFTSIFLNKGLCLYPKQTLSENIGLDGSGLHCNEQDLSTNFEFDRSTKVNKIHIKESKSGKTYLKRFFKYGYDSSTTKRLKEKYIQERYKLIKKIKGL